LVELKGGNDGLNTVVPYADGGYYALRPRLAVPREQVLQLDERSGLHPALAPLMPLWQARELAVVQGVGYPRPNLSHFRSIEIWDTASASDRYLDEGWLARCFDAAPPPAAFAADGAVIGSNDMGPLGGGRARAIALADPEQFQRQARLAVPATSTRRNAALAHVLKVEADIVAAASRLSADYAFRTEFPRSAFGGAVRSAAELAANRAGVAAIRLTLGGFDTHQNQLPQQQRLLGELAAGLAALRGALQEAGRWDDTLVMTYAEFGRRPAENGTGGTDHGTAAAHFVLGGAVRGGLYGEAPRLDALEGGNLRYAVDFRSLYATALERWWGQPSAGVLGGRFAPLELLKQV
ncbi:MAG TPA: DUF1501 domain-containing protein, partial [Burkholderiales bacterium]|nr:DUF1501 domain-containing protein [Burkholderiales bacterium]